jgi:hypothetical protein
LNGVLLVSLWAGAAGFGVAAAAGAVAFWAAGAAGCAAAAGFCTAAAGFGAGVAGFGAGVAGFCAGVAGFWAGTAEAASVWAAWDGAAKPAIKHTRMADAVLASELLISFRTIISSPTFKFKANFFMSKPNRAPCKFAIHGNILKPELRISQCADFTSTVIEHNAVCQFAIGD